MHTPEAAPHLEIVTFGGGTGGAAMVELSRLMPDIHVTMGVSTGDGGNCTNDLRKLFGGPAVGDLRKVLGHASTNAAGPLFHTRFAHDDSVSTIERLNDDFLDAIVAGGSEEVRMAENAAQLAVCIGRIAAHYQPYQLEGHTYGNFILTALRLNNGDDLASAVRVANGWLQTSATVMPVAVDSHNLVMYDKARETIIYGEGAIDKYILTEPTQMQVWLETGETANYIESDSQKVRAILERACYVPKPKATDEIRAAAAAATYAIIGPGSPITSLHPAVQPEGIDKSLSEQAVHGGLLLAVANSDIETTTPGFACTEYLQSLEAVLGRPFDHVVSMGGSASRCRTVARVAAMIQLLRPVTL